MTDRELLERILSREEAMLEFSSRTEYEWRFSSATLLAWVTDNPGDPSVGIRPHRAYEYRFGIGPDDRAIEDGTGEQRVRDFVEKLLAAAGEVRSRLQPAHQPYCETGYTRCRAVYLDDDNEFVSIQCPICDRFGTLPLARWNVLPSLGPRERQLTPKQHRQFFVNAP